MGVACGLFSVLGALLDAKKRSRSAIKPSVVFVFWGFIHYHPKQYQRKGRAVVCGEGAGGERAGREGWVRVKHDCNSRSFRTSPFFDPVKNRLQIVSFGQSQKFILLIGII